MSATCPACGQRNEDSREYCWACFVRLKAPTDAEAEIVHPAAVRRSSELDQLDFVAVRVLASLCLGVGVVFAVIGSALALTIILIPAAAFFLVLALLLIFLGIGIWKHWTLAWYGGLIVGIGLIVTSVRMLVVPHSGIEHVRVPPGSYVFVMLIAFIFVGILLRSPVRRRFHGVSKVPR